MKNIYILLLFIIANCYNNFSYAQLKHNEFQYNKKEKFVSVLDKGEEGIIVVTKRNVPKSRLYNLTFCSYNKLVEKKWEKESSIKYDITNGKHIQSTSLNKKEHYFLQYTHLKAFLGHLDNDGNYNNLDLTPLFNERKNIAYGFAGKENFNLIIKNKSKSKKEVMHFHWLVYSKNLELISEKEFQLIDFEDRMDWLFDYSQEQLIAYKKSAKRIADKPHVLIKLNKIKSDGSINRIDLISKEYSDKGFLPERTILFVDKFKTQYHLLFPSNNEENKVLETFDIEGERISSQIANYGKRIKNFIFDKDLGIYSYQTTVQIDSNTLAYRLYNGKTKDRFLYLFDFNNNEVVSAANEFGSLGTLFLLTKEKKNTESINESLKSYDKKLKIENMSNYYFNSNNMSALCVSYPKPKMIIFSW